MTHLNLTPAEIQQMIDKSIEAREHELDALARMSRSIGGERA